MAAAPHAGTHTEPRFVRKIQQKSHRNVALRCRTGAPSAPAKSIVYVTRPRAKCRRWVKRSDQAKGFVVLPKRWIVERTLAWLNRCRRLTKDWENLNRTALAFLRLASIRLMLRKLCNPHTLFRRKGEANTLGEISRGSGIYAAANCVPFPALELCFPPSFCLRLLISDLASRNSAVAKPSVNWS